jgi:hypothetical protein
MNRENQASRNQARIGAFRLARVALVGGRGKGVGRQG